MYVRAYLLTVAFVVSVSINAMQRTKSEIYEDLCTLHQVTRKGRVDLIESHLKFNLQLLNEKNSQNNTPLHEAILAGQKSACEFLLSWDAIVDLKALKLARNNNEVDILKILQAHTSEDKDKMQPPYDQVPPQLDASQRQTFSTTTQELPGIEITQAESSYGQDNDPVSHYE